MAQFVFTAKSNTPAGADQLIQQKLNSNSDYIVVGLSSTTCFDFQSKEIIYTITMVYEVNPATTL